MLQKENKKSTQQQKRSKQHMASCCNETHWTESTVETNGSDEEPGRKKKIQTANQYLNDFDIKSSATRQNHRHHDNSHAVPPMSPARQILEFALKRFHSFSSTQQSPSPDEKSALSKHSFVSKRSTMSRPKYKTSVATKKKSGNHTEINKSSVESNAPKNDHAIHTAHHHTSQKSQQTDRLRGKAGSATIKKHALLCPTKSITQPVVKRMEQHWKEPAMLSTSKRNVMRTKSLDSTPLDASRTRSNQLRASLRKEYVSSLFPKKSGDSYFETNFLNDDFFKCEDKEFADNEINQDPFLDFNPHRRDEIMNEELLKTGIITLSQLHQLLDAGYRFYKI